MIRRFILGMAASAALATVARGQNTCRSCVDSVSGQWHMLPALGLRAGIPQKASVALGIAMGKNYREKGHTEDLAVYVEPGLSAGRASIGYINGFGNMGSGFGFAATALRTWKDPINLKTNVTYAGAEVWVWPIFFSGPRIGLFRRVSGSSHSWFLTADFGVGL
jgi:hypothetical protein